MQQQKPISAVIFDCFGVLTGDRWKEFVATLPETQREGARDLNRALDRGIISQPEFVDQVHLLTGKDAPIVEKMISREMSKNTAILKYIQSLKPKYKTSVLSNVSSNWIRDTFLSSDEIILFDDFVLSYEVGLIKPDRQIYLLAAERLGVTAEECLFIDDSPPHTQAAAELGMKIINYIDFEQFKTEADKLLT